MYTKTAYTARPHRSNNRPRFSSRPSFPRKSTKQYINPSKFIQSAKPITDVVYQPQYNFADFEVDSLIKKNIEAKGFLTPLPIQDQAIPHGLQGKDVLGIANTGTGKTVAFAVPVLHQLMQSPQSKALIVAPTRELAQQIEAECRALAKGSGLNGALLIGGSSMPTQIRELKARPSIVIGTPGRMKDHVERGTLDLSSFNIVVLDEVDRMLDMGFINDIRFLINQLATPRQSLFFSATIDFKIKVLIESFLHEPVTISVKTGETSDNVEQNIVQYDSTSQKLDQLHNILLQATVAKTLIFDDTQRSVERLSKELQARGFRADAIHGGKSQSHRERALSRFRHNEIDILVATDVAARGIDVADITHVINYSTPNTYDDYIHRIGRAGRAGKAGHALTFVNR